MVLDLSSATTVGDLPTAQIVCTSETEPCINKEPPDDGSDSGIELCKYSLLSFQSDQKVVGKSPHY